MSCRRPLPLLALALALALAVLAGCRSEDDGPERPDGGGGVLAGLAGVRDTRSGLEEIEDGVRGLVIVADLDEDITVAQLTTVLETLAAERPDFATLSLGWGELPDDTSSLGGKDLVDLAYATLPATATERAEQFLTAARTFDGSVTLGPRGTEVVLADESPDAVTAAIRTTLADPVLRQVPDLSIRTGQRQPRDSSGLAAHAPVTAAILARWQALRGTLDRAPAGATAQTWIGEAGAVGDPAAPTRVRLDLVLSGVDRKGVVTPTAWGDRLWPLLRAQLDVVATLPRGTTYDVRVDVSGGGLPATDDLVALTLGAGPTPGRPPTAWDRRAASYLESVTRG
ncbi:hypothetical protein ACFJIY_19560 [Pimelobacter simplex]|uniref:hypothetical protein n=1 Tax=Nocardioides simplex TaxID=2045 RepID=UPI00366CA99C